MNKVMFLIVIACLVLVNGLAQNPDTIEWTVLAGGGEAGFIKKWKNADGSFTEWFEFNDRGRGDSTLSNYRYDSEGYLIFIEAAGVDYFKKPVFEKYKIVNGIADWENNSEKGTKKLEQKADYVPLKITSGVSFQPYFFSPNNTIEHLPSGRSKLTVLYKHTLPDKKIIRLVSVIGTGFTPNYSWIDENNEFFASPSDWFAYFRKGYEDLNGKLLEIQKKFEESYFQDLAKKLTITYKEGLAIRNARLFDPKTGTIKSNTTILVANGKVKEIGSTEITIPKGYRIIDALNKFVMPGLWDMHVHYGNATSGLLNLACGVTNVRDMGSGVTLLDKKKDIDNGVVLGPRIQRICGFIDAAGPYAGPIGEKINSVDEGKIAIKKYADLGYDQIKLYSSIKPEWVKKLADEAKRYKLRVSGHIPAYMTAEEAVLSGYDEIQHANMLFLNFYGKDLDTRTPQRFTTVAQKAAFFDFESDSFKAFLNLLKEKRTTIDPTVTLFEGMFLGKEGNTDPSFESIAYRFPLSFQRNLRSNGGLSIPKGQEETYKNSFNSILKMVKVLFDNGITIVPGTDGFAGFTLHRELENYVKAGIPNIEVLKLATMTSARIANKSELFGSIEVNKIADMIIIDGDPTKNIEDIRRIETVIKDKSIYQTKDLLEKISIGYFK